MPASRSASSSPMLLITVATMAWPFNRPSRCSWRAHISSTASPLTIAAAMIDEDRAVAVAVERDAGSAPALDDEPRERLGMRRPAAQVDVAAVRLVADDDRVEPEALEQRLRHRRRRAVGAVDRRAGIP